MQHRKVNYTEYAALWVFAIYAAGIITGWILLDQIKILPLIIILVAFLVLSLFFHLRLNVLFKYGMAITIFLAGVLNLMISLTVFGKDDIILKDLNRISEFTGWISETHYKKDGNHQYVLNCESVIIDSVEKQASGNILIKQRKLAGELHYGDQLKLTGHPELPPLPSNPGEFNYRRYLQLNHIYAQYFLNDESDYTLTGKDKGYWINRFLLEPMRVKLQNTIQAYVPSPTADVMQALILGEKQDIDQSIIRDFQATGIIHVLAISGLHVGFIILILLAIFSIIRLPYNLKIWLTLFCLFIFMALVDFKAPVVRASVMAGLYFIAKLLERFSTSINILGVAGLVILFVQPEQILQPGFQFSFAAVGAILYGYPKFKGYLPSTARFPKTYYFNKYFGQPFIVSGCAILGTMPLTWWYYGSLQIGALLINILIIPLIGLFVMFSFLLIALGIFALPGAVGLGTLIHYYFSFMLKMISYFASIPFVKIDMPNPGIVLVLLTAIAIFLVFKLNGIRKIIYPGILLLLIISFGFHKWSSNNNLTVTFIDVGQGDASLVKLPNGKHMLIDGGDLKPGMDAGERYVTPFLKYSGISRIEYLVGTHAHSDHIGGFFSVMDHFKIDTLVLPNYPADTKIFESLLKKAEEQNITIIHKTRGDKINADLNTRIYVLHPFGLYQKKTDQNGHEVNNSSLVLKVLYGNTSFLLTGDLEMDAEQFVASYGDLLDSDVLKVGHHGSRTSTGDDFLNLVSPDYSIISVGQFNRYFHPSRKTVDLISTNHGHPLRTDHFGALCFKSDGETIKLVNWRH